MSMGNTIGSIVQVADPEDDGEGGEFLRIRVTIDVTKALPRCCGLIVSMLVGPCFNSSSFLIFAIGAIG